MPAQGLKARLLRNGKPEEAGFLGLLGGMLPSVPVVMGGQTTTLGALFASIAGKQDGAAFLGRAAAVAMTKGTVVVGFNRQMLPADPFDAAHCGRVLGVLTADTALGVTGQVQALGPMEGVVLPTGGASDALCVGPGGALIRATPAGAKWRQIVGRSDGSTSLNITLGEASLIYDDADALIAPGGFNTPCPLDGGAVIDAFGYVTQAANARAFIAALAGAVPDGLPPRRGQFLRALEARQSGSIATLLSAVPSDAGDPINTAWFHTIGVLPTGRLAQFAKTTLGLSDVQLDAAIAASRSITE